MQISTIAASIRAEREYINILKTVDEMALRKKKAPMLVTGLCEGAGTLFLCALAADIVEKKQHPFLCIVPDEKQARILSEELSAAGLRAPVFGWRDFVYHNMTASREFEHGRLGILADICAGNIDVCIATPDAALQFTMPRATLEASMLTLTPGDEISPEAICEILVNGGYARVDTVDGAGQFSRRGGILDVFSPQSKNPARIEFFGDEIDSVSSFDIMTQRRLDMLDSYAVIPSREIAATDEVRGKIADDLRLRIRKAKDDRVRDMLAAELEAASNDSELDFIDKYIKLVYGEGACLLDYFTDSDFCVTVESAGVSDRIQSYEWHLKQQITELLEEGSISAEYAEYGKYRADYDAYFDTRAGVILDTFASSLSGKSLSGMFSFTTRQTVGYADNIPLLLEDLAAYRKNKFATLLLCENETTAKNLLTTLTDEGYSAAVLGDSLPEAGTIGIAHGIDTAGFELSVTKFAVLSLWLDRGHRRSTYTSKKRKAAKKKAAGEKIISYADLEVGDYVVHTGHGIGQYLGLQSLTVDGATRDFVKIKYAGKDMLYLPCNQLDSISKYIGAHSDDGMLKLSKMGGAEWGKAKARVKAAAKQMAKELIALYAERMRRDGFAFSPDDDFQREFEDSFEYEETDGQLEAVEDIKRDMERSVPMDRLLCGDVGFGKTEVAMRAAFKAVASQKQVAILVPTTILAMQHYQTLLARMRGFPVHIDMVSRFRTPAMQQEALRRLRRGETDIIVGTHRLVSNDVKFKDLGLVIVDEEQRFGVAHKEKLKQLSKNVDVLTLTATPIPRTLSMAMSGIRDMSVLEEAPGDRLPVQTYVLEYDEIILGEAIRRELRRGGQVFYLHNRVESMDRVAAIVSGMAPDARIETAHGQMDKETLSDIWRRMVTGEVDILISTTIIETGIDVPNANTLIIEDADKMGLSQLHQIRGRVGRSSRRAYAYFTYPKGRILSEVASKRLSAIRDFTEFGSGFKVALRDLEIRGAGNILGAEQHGHLDSVGYDLYMKILNEAVLEERGETVTKKLEATVDLNIDAYIPEKYIRTAAQRIDAYKKIAAIENDEDLSDVTDELLDRWGDMPRAVQNLLSISRLRALACECRIFKIEQKESCVLLRPEKIDVRVWSTLAAQSKGKLLMNMSATPYISYRIRRDEDPLAFICALLKNYLQIKAENAANS
ncbi:MAG: transcription-repair coupling factor [Clostridia bacterium]|nr:transcription-repair coupling factor [Clostridia bacterium]